MALKFSYFFPFVFVALTIRAGPLFNTGFLRRMLVAAVQHNMEDIQPLVKTLICEADCTTLKPFSVPGYSALSNQGVHVLAVTYLVTLICDSVQLETLNQLFEQWGLDLNVLNNFDASLLLVECGVVIKTLQKVEEGDTSDQSGICCFINLFYLLFSSLLFGI